jgi:hypothetical protein
MGIILPPPDDVSVWSIGGVITGKGKTEVVRENLCQGYFIHHTPCMQYVEYEHMYPQ